MDPHLLKKYKAYPTVDLPDRVWPNRSIEHAPTWCSVDLRDGNQSLVHPMSLEKKLLMFELLVEIGFKEIEVAFPAASKTDFQFVRHLIDNDLIPQDVTIQVLTPASQSHIERTCDAIMGAKNVIVNLYLATAINHRKIVFNKSKDDILSMLEHAVCDLNHALFKREISPRLLFSPEAFTDTELDFAVSACDVVIGEWAGIEPVIINLPATVELSTPNIFADRIEWFLRHSQYKNNMILSVHPHNDRGTAVAAAELALLAGAHRVEGTLLGNGERTGNVDLVVLALNLYTQGVDPKLDLSDLGRIVSVFKYCTQMSPHPRQAYSGSMVFTCFSGTHQDAIKKGFAYRAAHLDDEILWQVPYLPIDPQDIGRKDESFIRINSQSGKAAPAFLLEREYGCLIPVSMQRELADLVQAETEKTGVEMSAIDLWHFFSKTYLLLKHPIKLISVDFTVNKNTTDVSLEVFYQNKNHMLMDKGDDPIDASLQAIIPIVSDCQTWNLFQSVRQQGVEVQTVSFIELVCGEAPCFGVGIDPNSTKSSILALISAVNRLLGR